MTTLRPLADVARGLMHDALVPIGCGLVAKDRFAWNVTADVMGLVTFQYDLYPTRHAVEITPRIGVHYLPLEELIAAIEGARKRRAPEPTVERHLSELISDATGQFVYSAWAVSDAQDASVASRQIQREIVDRGKPWASTMADPDRIWAAISRGFPRRTGDRDSVKRVPVMLLLRGKPEEALAAIDQAMREVRNRNDDFGVEAATFDARFREYVARL